MKLITLLNNAIEERFKADCIVKAIEKEIVNIAEYTIYEKYKTKKLYRDNMQFELIGVRVYFSVWGTDIPKLDIRLAYVVSDVTKLPNDKKKKIKEVINCYLDKKYLMYCNYKLKLWDELNYELELEKFMSDKYNLIIQ